MDMPVNKSSSKQGQLNRFMKKNAFKFIDKKVVCRKNDIS